MCVHKTLSAPKLGCEALLIVKFTWHNIYKRKAILSITIVKSESIVLVCVVNLLSQIVSFRVGKSPGNLCYRPSVKEVRCQWCDFNCERLSVNQVECEILLW